MSESKPKRSLRRIFATALGVVVCLILLLMLVVSTRPDTFSVSRSATIPAAAEEIYPFVNNLRQWREWSPYEQLDADMQREYSGPAAGTGATYRWVGNSQAGVGSIRITESTPHQRVRLLLAMEKPFDCANDVEFLFEQGDETGDTVVTWTMSGHLGFLPKLMHLVFNIDGMIGDQFDEGLDNLRSIVAEQRTDPAAGEADGTASTTGPRSQTDAT